MAREGLLPQLKVEPNSSPPRFCRVVYIPTSPGFRRTVAIFLMQYIEYLTVPHSIFFPISINFNYKPTIVIELGLVAFQSHDTNESSKNRLKRSCDSHSWWSTVFFSRCWNHVTEENIKLQRTRGCWVTHWSYESSIKKISWRFFNLVVLVRIPCVSLGHAPPKLS